MRQRARRSWTNPAEIWAEAELVVKVKEPQPIEWRLLRPGQAVFTYFHFAADEPLTRAIIESGITAIAYETLRDPRGGLPLLTPMSEVAGRMSIQEGAKFLERPQEGRGILLSGVPGVAPAEIAILGGGVVGSNAAKVAAGLGANVRILDINLDRLRYLDDIMPPQRHDALFRPPHDRRVDRTCRPGHRRGLDHRRQAPRLVKRDDLARMKTGAVIVDVAIDQGGCVATSRPTTHRQPTYLVSGVVHYCVTNMPGAVGRTSTYALCNVTLPYVLKMARHGWRNLAGSDPGVALGVNIDQGMVTNQAVAATFGLAISSVGANPASVTMPAGAFYLR